MIDKQPKDKPILDGLVQVSISFPKSLKNLGEIRFSLTRRIFGQVLLGKKRQKNFNVFRQFDVLNITSSATNASLHTM